MENGESVASRKMFRCSLRVRGREYFSENGDILPLARGDILLKHVEKKKKKKTIRKKSLRLQLKRSNKRALKFYSRVEALEDIYDVLLRALRHLGDTLSVVFCLSSYAKISPRKKRYRGGNREANRQKTTLPPLFSILSSLSTTRNCVQKFSIAATLQDRTQGRWFNRGNYVRLFAKG